MKGERWLGRVSHCEEHSDEATQPEPVQAFDSSGWVASLRSQ